MKRRQFLFLAGATPLMFAFSGLSRSATTGQWRVYDITYDVVLAAEEGPARLWLPLPQSVGDYQRVLSAEWNGNAAKAAFYWDEVYRAPIFHAAWPETDMLRRVAVTTRVATLDRAVEPARHPKGGRGPANPEASFYLKPTPSMPVDGIVGETAREITRKAKDPVDKARAIYEWVVDNTFRDPKVQGCGLGDIHTMLETGNLGGKCADINSLFVGLARAAGVPAREMYGVRVGDSSQFQSLGRRGNISKAQHCRAEFYLDRAGWVPVDPADVRKVVLEEKLPLDDPRVTALRRRLFGSWEMNWVAFNSGRDFDLAPRARKPVKFFMYPYAEIGAGSPNGLDPASFSYRIESREVAIQ